MLGSGSALSGHPAEKLLQQRTGDLGQYARAQGAIRYRSFDSRITSLERHRAGEAETAVKGIPHIVPVIFCNGSFLLPR
jgi:hypothetical protein